MPILPAETDRFPQDLFAGYVPDTATSWWVLHTRPRQEKSLARELLERDLPFYLPQVTHRSRIRGRTLTAHVPLFTSYVFLLGTDRQRLAALTTHRVVQAIRVSDQERIGAELAQVHRLLASGAPVTPEDRLGPGSEVEIGSGPLAGMHGTIVRSGTGRRFVIRVDFIQRGAAVELDDATLVRALI